MFNLKRSIMPTLIAGLGLTLAATMPVSAAGPSFVDPTATRVNPANIHLGELDYVGPFAQLRAGTNANRAIHVGNETNIQDNVIVNASAATIRLGDQVILAHGATVNGPAEIGESGVCPDAAAHCPSFVGFNAEVSGAIIQKDAMVLHLARVAPGVTIPSGRKVLPGKNITSNAQVAAKTAAMTAADRAFMHGVIEVNLCFASAYTALAADPTNLTGINYDPDCAFNPGMQLPTLHSVSTRNPAFRNRIIGDVHLENTLAQLNTAMGSSISLRADEGAPFELGSIAAMGNRTTFHALEHTHIHMGGNGRYGVQSLVHGGPVNLDNTTITGDNFRLKTYGVFFRSTAGNNVRVGCRSLVQNSNLADGTVIPDKRIIIDGLEVGRVEWGACSTDD
jgi:carbonic anhydrase/acetyltransferase-like protein (isoleucine patch superfamily)